MVKAFGFGPAGGEFVRGDVGWPAYLAAECGHTAGSAAYALDEDTLTRLADRATDESEGAALRWLIGEPAVAVFVDDLAAGPGRVGSASGGVARGADREVRRLVEWLLAGRVEEEDGTTVLWRPTGPDELRLVEESGWRRWPPRLGDQPIFYPVLNEAYARQIAVEWNVPASGVGHVTRFRVETGFARRYPTRRAGGRDILELWVPAEELEAFNEHIVGLIEVVETVR